MYIYICHEQKKIHKKKIRNKQFFKKKTTVYEYCYSVWFGFGNDRG